MATSFDKLRNIVLKAVEEEHQKSGTKSNDTRRSKVLSELILVRLAQQGMSIDQFAQKLGLSTDVSTLLFAGALPDWLISDNALDRFAVAADCDPNLLRIVLDRSPIPGKSEGADGSVVSGMRTHRTK